MKDNIYFKDLNKSAQGRIVRFLTPAQLLSKEPLWVPKIRKYAKILKWLNGG